MTMKNPWRNNSDKRKFAVEQGFKSGLECDTYDDLQARGVDVIYEERAVKFTPPAKERTYHPDFTLPNGILIETKGRFVTADRQKMKAIKAQYPNLDIRFVFGNAQNRISAASKTTYAMWAEQHGFKWADKKVPQEWLDEPPNEVRIQALRDHTTLTKANDRGTM
jgi:hypothetical protein